MFMAYWTWCCCLVFLTAVSARRAPGTIRILSAVTREMRQNCETKCPPHQPDCIFSCMSPKCHNNVYKTEPVRRCQTSNTSDSRLIITLTQSDYTLMQLEEGEVDHYRESQFLACLRTDLALNRRRAALKARDEREAQHQYL